MALRQAQEPKMEAVRMAATKAVAIPRVVMAITAAEVIRVATPLRMNKRAGLYAPAPTV